MRNNLESFRGCAHVTRDDRIVFLQKADKLKNTERFLFVFTNVLYFEGD